MRLPRGDLLAVCSVGDPGYAFLLFLIPDQEILFCTLFFASDEESGLFFISHFFHLYCNVVFFSVAIYYLVRLKRHVIISRNACMGDAVHLVIKNLFLKPLMVCRKSRYERMSLEFSI